MPEPEYQRRAATLHGANDSDWSRLCQRAKSRLLRQLSRRGELSPRETATVVATLLPGQLGRWLLRRLDELGWLAPDACITFDVLDGPACPPAFRGDVRELVRLAVFGPGGQGLAWRDRHRHDVYQRLCAEIMREAVDLVSLQNVANRVLNNADVSADPLLGTWLRSYIAERENALRTLRTPDDEYQEHAHESKLRYGFESPTDRAYPTRDEVLEELSRRQREYDGYLAQFEERKALRTLEQIREVRKRFPVHVPAADLQRCEEQYDRLLKRIGTYQRQIGELATRGAAAARDGDGKTAAWVMRRLEAIHSLLPSLLPTARLEQLRAEITRCGHEHETQEAARELRQRKNEVATKIRNLAGVIQRFHQLAGKLPPDHNAYRRAELNYRRAVEEIRGMNTEWLSGLVIELETLLEDLDDPSGKMQNQLDQFIGNVRTALNRLCLEIRSRQRNKNRTRGRGAPPPTGQSPPQPA